MLKVFVFFVILLFSSLSTASSLAWVSEQLKTETKNSGSFVQKKMLSVLPRPIISEGVYRLQQDGAQLFWHTQKPIDSLIIIKKQGIYEHQDGKNVELLKANGGEFTKIEQLFSALLKGNLMQLEKYFSLKLLSEDNQLPWHLQLLPNDENLKNIIKKIELHGDSSVNKILVHESESSSTLIELNSQ